jgi:hypothetical protein
MPISVVEIYYLLEAKSKLPSGEGDCLTGDTELFFSTTKGGRPHDWQ